MRRALALARRDRGAADALHHRAVTVVVSAYFRADYATAAATAAYPGSAIAAATVSARAGDRAGDGDARVVSFESGRLARLTDGVVLARAGDTVALCAATTSRDYDASSAIKGFVPLMVDYRERSYAKGEDSFDVSSTRGRAQGARNFSHARDRSRDATSIRKRVREGNYVAVCCDGERWWGGSWGFMCQRGERGVDGVVDSVARTGGRVSGRCVCDC